MFSLELLLLRVVSVLLQLPPVIKNMSFQKYSNMEQSMFSRFVRLGVPTIQLDAQGRARPSLCQLYKWRYKSLGDLPHVMQWPDYRVVNPGMLYDYQLVDVGDFNGVGETEPTPHFIQVCLSLCWDTSECTGQTKPL